MGIDVLTLVDNRPQLVCHNLWDEQRRREERGDSEYGRNE